MTTTQELLESSFELNLNNYGPEDVERLNDWAIKAHNALEALQAEAAELESDYTDQVLRAVNAESERDAALARLAESEAQNLMARQIILEHGEGVAGASPVEPLTKTQIEKGMMALLWCAASDLERLNPNMYEGYKDDVTRVYSAITTETTRN